MGFIVIDYDSLVWVMVFAFAAIGLSRGWLTEFINTILLMLLSILLVKPDMLTPILTKLNQLLKLLVALFKSGLSLDPGELSVVILGVEDIIDPNNPYPVLLVLTIVVLAVQYAGTRVKLTGDLTAFSRILGAILGAINANIVLSLGKELIRKNMQMQVARASVSAQEMTAVQAQVTGIQALAPNGVAVAMKDVPVGFLPESYWIWIGGAVLAVGAILMASHFTKKPIGSP
jgi:uncharacterized membrane protein YecN with MAPEG domain